jgi:hypothetical protein
MLWKGGDLEKGEFPADLRTGKVLEDVIGDLQSVMSRMGISSKSFVLKILFNSPT